jgi:hypothetical protein
MPRSQLTTSVIAMASKPTGQAAVEGQASKRSLLEGFRVVVNQPFIIFLLGALAGPLGTYFLQAHDLSNAKRDLAFAFIGEISAMAIDKSQTIPTAYLSGLLSELEHGRTVDPRDRPPERNVALYEANAGKLGYLGPCLSRDIARFYGAVSRLRANIDALGSGTYRDFSSDDKAKWLAEYVRKESAWQKDGERILENLKKFIDGKEEEITCAL